MVDQHERRQGAWSTINSKEQAMTKAQAGRLGGKRTAQKHGRNWMQDIGRIGAFVTHSRYRLEPSGPNDFAMVHRKTGEVKAYLSGKHKRSSK